ncbi:hypothetical protein V3C99_015773 [Haemonchus contortus]
MLLYVWFRVTFALSCGMGNFVFIRLPLLYHWTSSAVRGSIAVFLIFIYLPSFIQLAVFSVSSQNSDMTKKEIEEETGYNVSSDFES